ncbi:hypothetical protein LTR10_017245 [Elasticomyces elasticus]|uniref:GED domain-containing protein n=1 Tax=Exophiala sideris TaxID=1016849 RepID=A0ABR0JI69_9EURO|nr:hypothetical protein LTR10_017245 [Elasticomyces elasticus]KAK5034195.1 hypothetical protein LTS07_003115 [Exophiala sideris]KAK5042491.1 hypothetical protein LTR13_001338 [Exophiala sideris]KAK5065573.1 hypothetical protein LTR69_003122 [Exophiala sideris]KAK5185969.1 hypothetical protein LTR44_002018 [Eurotiomycetes sp. CCFEE 6388]
MADLRKTLATKSDEMLKPYVSDGHPTTYDDHFAEIVQRKRRKETNNLITKKVYNFFGLDQELKKVSEHHFEGEIDVEALVEALVNETVADFDRFACVEATNAMEAYYEVALKNVVDAFGTYALEGCLLERLPKLFSPDMVLDLDDETVKLVAAESVDMIEERENVERKLAILEVSLKTLQSLRFQRAPGVLDDRCKLRLC